MANQIPSESNPGDAVESAEEDVSESFICCVCLDLLYKPVVLPCGHVSCFWCVHKSMSCFQESHCPFCRHAFYHFPTICQKLYFLLLKMYPIAYRRREKRILEEEIKSGFFSPHLDGKLSGCHSDEGSTNLSESAKFFLSSLTSNETSVSCKGYSDLRGKHSGSQLEGSGETSTFSTPMSCDAVRSSEASTNDVLCPSCKLLLFRPAVLNCGHVYCETCIIVPQNEAIKCQLCGCQHPSTFPKACLEFCNFLEEKFPKEYAARRDAIKQQTIQCQGSVEVGENPELASSVRKEVLPWKSEDDLTIHIGVGCDFCGIYPIIGDRYRCKDCVEAIGFDLCGDCYNTRSKLPGRFNQQHTPDHWFEQMKPQKLLRLVARPMGDGPTFSNLDAGEYTVENAIFAELPGPLVDADVHVTALANPENDGAGDENLDQPMF